MRKYLYALPVPFLLAQLGLGTSPVIVLLVTAAFCVFLTPYILQGFNLYSLLAFSVGARYVIVPTVAKTIMGQSLEEHLLEPLGAYVMTLVVITLLVAVVLIAQRLDNRKALVPFSHDINALQWLAIITFLIGGAASAVAGVTASHQVHNGSPGPVFILSSVFSNFFLVALSAQLMVELRRSGGTRLLGVPIVLMLSLALVFSVFLNVRQFFFYGVLAMAITAMLCKALRWRHVIIGGALMVFFVLYVSPLIIVLRYEKEGTSAAQFAELCLETFEKSLTDPHYADEAIQRQHLKDMRATGLTQIDYYGNRSDVLNRFSFVGIADRAANSSKYRDHLGLENYRESFSRLVPKIFFKNKVNAYYQHADWVAWNLGIEPVGYAWAITYPEPFEDFSALGWLAFLMGPFVWELALLLVLSKTSSLKALSPFSIALIPHMHIILLEGDSCLILQAITRTLPIFALASIALWRVSSFFSLLRPFYPVVGGAPAAPLKVSNIEGVRQAA